MSEEMVSIIIPSRNEVYLEQTIRSILEAAEGEIEILVMLDGYMPDPQIHIEDDRVIFHHFEESIGQRPAINEGARLAKGKYILKTDAHSMFDVGFDVKLAADCEYDWTVLPRMYNLDVGKWEPKKRKVTDYMWIRSPKSQKKPFRHYYYDGPCKREEPAIYKNHKAWAKEQPDISDVMTGQGACFFMHKDRFWELGGMDEGHGQWGQMGLEVAMKAWLSGGRHVVNKKTWFAHYFRGGRSGEGFPWPASGKAHEKARKYSNNLWINEKWPLQKRPLQWLIDKFEGQHNWGNEMEEENSKVKEPKPHSQAYALAQCKNQHKKIIPGMVNTLRSDKSSDKWFAKGRWFSVKELFKNRLNYARPEHADGIRWQEECVPPFVKRIVDGEKFTDDQLKELEYYKYLVSRLNPKVNPPDGPTRKGVRHVLNMMKDMINLTYSMRDGGLRAPLDFFIRGEVENGKDRVIIIRGGRRLVIAYYLGWKRILGRVWKTEHLSKRFIPTNKWPDSGITKIAADQFAKHGKSATDKYWKHGYTYWYDIELAEHKGGHPIKILELGVARGASLMLWKDAFPNATVYGIDRNMKNLKPQFTDDAIHYLKCDINDTKKLNQLAKEHGPFTVIIDDANHDPKSQKQALKVLWPHVESQINRGGMYVIEDLHHNFRDTFKSQSILPTLTEMIDDIYTSNEVRDVSFHPNIVFIRKA